MKPEDICVRTLNHYRHYDVLAYLGLRYYLHNAATRSDLWVQQLATDVAMTRDGANYLYSQHFKEFDETGKIKHRSIYIPGPNEALAEAALLSECANHDIFLNPNYIFSYSLNIKDRRGIYTNYMDGIIARQEAIARACRDYPNGVVAYTDIKNFYPSITTELAIRVWRNKCKMAGLSEIYLSLGERLISDHGQASGGTSPHILIGPMFSHFIANLVLRYLDEEFIALPVEYFRYVDDITLVGEKDKVTRSIQIIRDRLQQEYNLYLHEEHSPKNITLPVSEWLKGKDDFKKNEISHDWMKFVGDLKKFLLFNDKHYETVQAQFLANGFRIPFRSYSTAILERGYIVSTIFLLDRTYALG